MAAGQILAHVPDLVLSGSKPAREILADADLATRICAAMRTSAMSAGYLPNQVFIGLEEPRPLTNAGRPWWENSPSEIRSAPTGALFYQDEFMAAMSRVDSAGLMSLSSDQIFDRGSMQGELVESLSVTRLAEGSTSQSASIPGRNGSLGVVSWGYPGDEALAPAIMLENIATKTSAALALSLVLKSASIDPQQLDLVISCSEEAVGDRYQRGGGNLGKAIGEAVGASRSSGFDVKNFCAGPIPALVVASSLVATGVARTIAVVAGGSVPKLGMKFEGHLKAGMPVLEDCLGGVAAIVSAAGEGPVVRHDAVGMHSVGAGGSNEQIIGELAFEPLARVGLKVADIDLFGTELHNSELTVPQGSGDVPLRNYRTLAALAVKRGEIARSDFDEFLAKKCVAGFAPTQGHIASAICLLPYILAQLGSGRISRAQLIAKGSLFLGRMSSLSDGMSIVVES